MSCYPLYLTIGNIPKKIWRTYSQHAYVLVGYLPYLNATGREGNQTAFIEAKRMLYHECMKTIMKDLEDATLVYILSRIIPSMLWLLESLSRLSNIYLSPLLNHRGRLWKCSDGQTRNYYPVVAAFQVDYPESQMLTLTRQNNACPTCMARKIDFGNLAKKHDARTPELATCLYNRAKDIEESWSVKNVDKFLQEYSQIYLEVHL